MDIATVGEWPGRGNTHPLPHRIAVKLAMES